MAIPVRDGIRCVDEHLIFEHAGRRGPLAHIDERQIAITIQLSGLRQEIVVDKQDTRAGVLHCKAVFGD